MLIEQMQRDDFTQIRRKIKPVREALSSSENELTRIISADNC